MDKSLNNGSNDSNQILTYSSYLSPVNNKDISMTEPSMIIDKNIYGLNFLYNVSDNQIQESEPMSAIK